MSEFPADAQVLYQSGNALVQWFPTEKVVFKRFAGFVKSEEVRAAFTAGHQAFSANRATRWLSDNRAVKPYIANDIAWINEVWFPTMKTAGWKHWALVEPASALGSLSMKNFIGEYAKNGVDVKPFVDVPGALAWLRTV